MFLMTTSMINLVAAGALSFGPTTVNPGAQCAVNFEHDIVVSPHSLSITRDQQSWGRDAQGMLTFNQEPQSVDAKTSELLAEYHQGIYAQASQFDDIMAEAAAMTRYALNTTFSEMFSPRHRVVKRIDSLADDIEADMRSLVGRDGETFYIYGSQLDDFSDRLSATLDEEIDNIVTESMGSMFMLIGRALLTGSGGFEQRMEQFGERMENMAENLEAEMESRAEKLEAVAQGMCEQMLELQVIESQLQQSHASLTDLDVFSARADDFASTSGSATLK